MPDDNDAIRSRSIWSGTITFGLVSIPVNLFPGNRSQLVSLRMLDEDGTPLARRYFCPADDREIDSNEVARGYELEDGRFVLIEDDELEAIEPRKSRDIDLRQFVPVEQLDPIFFERAYFLAPDGSNKAYRLLAESMEKLGRAGIATFVMRDREYLVAIISERGILRAETLRFADELRSAKDVGLPKPAAVSDTVVRKMQREIRKQSEAKLSRTELKDNHAEQLISLAEKKRNRREDVIEIPEQAAEEAEGGAEIIDLVEILRRSMSERESRAGTAATRSRASAAKRRRATGTGRKTAGQSRGHKTAGRTTRKSTGTSGRKSAAGSRKRSEGSSAGKSAAGSRKRSAGSGAGKSAAGSRKRPVGSGAGKSA